jgi:hypothetical protein
LQAFAANTGTLANLEALEAAHWGIMLAPYRPRLHPDFEFEHCIDNGAWPIYTRGLRDGICYPFDEVSFKKLLYRHGADAKFVVVPDIVAGGERSLEFSVSWLYTLRGIKRPLLALQDGMTPKMIEPILREWKTSNLGLFLGGTTEWKLSTMAQWGEVAKRNQCWYHVGRVNTAKRIDMCGAAGANSFDGSSATRYVKTLELLDRTRRKYMCIDELEDWRKASELRAQTAGAAANGSGSRIAPAPKIREIKEQQKPMANINLQQFISELRTEFLSVYNAVVDITAEAAFNNAALVVLARQIDGGGAGVDTRQLPLPLSRGQKAAATRKKNVAKRARATANSGAGVSTGDGAKDSPNA